MPCPYTKEEKNLHGLEELARREVLTHNIIMPKDLVVQLLEGVDTSGSILVLYNLETAIVLIGSFDVDPSQITFFGANDQMKAAAENLRINTVDRLEPTMKFDAIIANPPYKGKAELHQQFFNDAVDRLVDGGTLAFVQPATVYLNKKPKQRRHTLAMRENIRKYETTVKILPPSVFDAGVITDVSLTTLTKTSSQEAISTYVDIKRNISHNVLLEDINMTTMRLSVYRSLKVKIQKAVEDNGSLQDYISRDKSELVLPLQKIRGHPMSDDFYTFISRDKKYTEISTGKTYGVPVKDQEEADNIVSYLKTYIARFALSLYKFNTNNHMGEFRMVPMMLGHKGWTDDDLKELFNITEEEYAEIRRVIPEYY